MQRELVQSREEGQGYLIALRVAERTLLSLSNTNNQMMEQLLSSHLASSHPHHSKPPSQPPSTVSDGYTVSREQVELYNQLSQPKVGPGSQNQRMPLWLFKESGETSLDKELKGVVNLSGFRGPSFPPVSGGSSKDWEKIAGWLLQFRVRMKQASVRFLASQDSSVLGAELYTKSAFDKLMKRANAITADMTREAQTLRSGENEHNELALQLSLLLQDTVETTSNMNSLAAVVHSIMLRRITKLQENWSRDEATAGAEGVGGWLKGSMGGSGTEAKDEGLLSLASLSGLFGDITTNGVEGSKDALDSERMREMLAEIDKAIAEQRLGIDHRANGFSNSRNAGSQMARQQRQVQHNTLFGLMTSRLADATATTQTAADFKDN